MSEMAPLKDAPATAAPMSEEERRKAQEAEHEKNMAAYKSDTQTSRLKLLCHPCLNLYMCTMFGHKFHVTEVFCLGAFILCVLGGVFVLTKSPFPTYIFSIGLAIYSLLSIIFVWDYVSVSSLAAIATRLEGIAKRGQLEAAKYNLINDSLEEQTSTYKSQLGLLGEGTTGIDVEIGNLDALIPKLEEMQEVHESLNKRQIELGDREEAFARESKLAVEDKAKELVKSALKVLFEAFPKLPFRQGVARATPDAVEAIRGFLRVNDVPFTPALTPLLSGKFVNSQDLVEYVDRELSTRFFRLKFAAETTRQKEHEVYEQRQELSRLRSKSERIERGILDPEDLKEIQRRKEERKQKKAQKEKEEKERAAAIARGEELVAVAPSGGDGDDEEEEPSVSHKAAAVSFAALPTMTTSAAPAEHKDDEAESGHHQAAAAERSVSQGSNKGSHRDDEHADGGADNHGDADIDAVKFHHDADEML